MRRLIAAVLSVGLLFGTGCAEEAWEPHDFGTGYPADRELYAVITCPVHDVPLDLAEVPLWHAGFHVCFPFPPPDGYDAARKAGFPFARNLVRGRPDDPFGGHVPVNRCHVCDERELEWLGPPGD